MSRHTLSGPPSNYGCEGILDEKTKTVKSPLDKSDLRFVCLLRNRTLCTVPHPSCDTHPCNAHILHVIPADQHLELPFSPLDHVCSDLSGG